MALAPINRHSRRLRRRYGKVRRHLFTFLDHPEITADNNGSKRELRPTAIYRNVTGGFRSSWGAEFFANVRSVVGTAARHSIDAYAAIKMRSMVLEHSCQVEQLPFTNRKITYRHMLEYLDQSSSGANKPSFNVWRLTSGRLAGAPEADQGAPAQLWPQVLSRDGGNKSTRPEG
jgi:hypothetical protein